MLRVTVARRCPIHLGDPFHVLFQRGNEICGRRRTSGRLDDEQVESGHHQPQVGRRPLGVPDVAQRHAVASLISMRRSAPVMASNPVANTITSIVDVAPLGPGCPRGVMAVIAPLRRSTSVTLSRLNVW